MSGDRAPDHPPPRNPPALPIALAVKATLQQMINAEPYVDEFLLTVIEHQGQPLFIASRLDHLGIARAVASADGWRATETLTVKSGGFINESRYHEIAIEVRNGTVKGKACATILVGGEALSTYQVTGTVAGDVETATAELVVQGKAAEQKLHPLDGVTVRSSRPLAPDTQLGVVAPDGSVIVLEPHYPTIHDPAVLAAVSAVGAVELRTTRHLSADTTYQLKVLRGGQDLLGRAGTLPASIGTRAIPLMMEDGFESGGPALLDYFRIVGADTLPPLSGQRSLYVEHGRQPGRFTARLTIAPGDRMVRVAYRHVSFYENIRWPSDFTFFRVIAPGSEPARFDLPEPPTLTQDPGSKLWLGPPVTLEVPLPAGATGEVIVDLHRWPLYWNPFPSTGFQLDDLRVE